MASETPDAEADPRAPATLVVRRWARYGHDRLYVEVAGGARIGYWDNRTGTAVVDDEADRAAFDAALAEYRGKTGVAPPPVPPLPPAPPAPPAEAVAYFAGPVVAPADLAATPAGAAARERAEALRQAAPVRTFVARVLGVKNDERAWRIGADAEEAVAARLAKLGERWKVLHAVPVGENGSDIDHVVIGPGGVFTVNTKHHPGASVWVGGDTVMVNGQRVPYVRNSRFEARRTGRLLGSALGTEPVPVTGVVAVMGAHRGFTVKAQPEDGAVVVLTRRELRRWLGRQDVRLTDEQVRALYAVARRPGTWHR